MSVKITYLVHGTTTDNEQDLCTGWAPGDLSELGIQQAKELGQQVDDKKFDAFFTSDLKRATDSAQLGFGDKYEFIQDNRLRECNYGDITQASEAIVIYKNYIDTPFPSGESMKDVEQRVSDFLEYLKKEYDNKQIAIMAHKAPQLAIEVILNKKTWQQAIDQDWRKTKSWQPGWDYYIN
ncbi:histidine phosphatase family protein [Patescibacteria group bacterium]|nr:histidine phosphatase family protein [Patescibacteria group bacterium]MBU1890810.1 histidine phosphatase family protein [Patescibacteria group bacterium]